MAHTFPSGRRPARLPRTLLDPVADQRRSSGCREDFNGQPYRLVMQPDLSADHKALRKVPCTGRAKSREILFAESTSWNCATISGDAGFPFRYATGQNTFPHGNAERTSTASTISPGENFFGQLGGSSGPYCFSLRYSVVLPIPRILAAASLSPLVSRSARRMNR